jgi:toxin HigB-1
MISSFQDQWLRAFFIDDVHTRHSPADIEDRVFRKLQMIDDATTDQDLGYRQALTSKNCRAN